ncbi:MAG: DoxX family protein [Pseudolabrys sp.]|nr:DoxX family protein [Pseudolabrys sp.]MCW5685832.1 DoxX family protein [Pseudolabrys sp.]
MRDGTVNDSHRRLLIPQVAPLYEAIEPFAYALMRLASGLIMANLGWMKLFGGGMARDIELFQQLGLAPAVPLAYFTSGLEFFGGIAVGVGFLTRPLAAMLLGELIVIVLLVMIPRGAGYHLSVVWLGVFLFILIHGGGRISVDRMLGREF